MKRLLVVLLVACGSEKSGEKPVAQPPPVAVDAAPAPIMRVALGDCARKDMQFVSGPKPIPLGTIGTGNLGTIGGFGIRGGGRSGMTRRTSAPIVRIGQMNAVGNLDRNIIRRYVKRNIGKITYCYEKELVANPKLADGVVSTSWTITAIGATQDAKADGLDTKVSECVRAVLAAIEYPKPKGGGVSKVELPFTFNKPPPGSPPSQPASNPQSPSEYEPGLLNPLHEHKDSLRACLAKSPKRHGVFVIDFGYELASGKIIEATPHGLDEATAQCISTFAKTVKTPLSIFDPTERCSYAYGTMPLSELPAIAIESTGMSLSGERIADTAALTLALKAEHTEPVRIQGPLLLRAVSTTSMTVINNVLRAAAEGDEHNVFLESQIDFEIPRVPIVAGYGTFASMPLRITVEPDGGTIDGTHYAKDDFQTQLGLVAERNVRAIVSGQDATTFADVLAVTQTLATSKLRWKLVAP